MTDGDGFGDGAARGRRALHSSKILAVAFLPLLFPVAGCANACTAVGWFDELEVEVTGSGAAEVDRLEVCFDGSCYSGGVSDREKTGPQFDVVAVAVAKTETGWTITTSMQTPETVQLRASSESGEVLAEHVVDLSWKRVGGSARCGGPHEAKTTISLGL